jgi:hypothetical protein
MISPYYDVVMIPTLDGHHRDEVNPLMEDLNGHHPDARCMSSHRSWVTGRRNISSEKEILQGPFARCERVLYDPMPSIFEEHFMYTLNLIFS